MYEIEIKQKMPLLFALSTCPRCQRMKKFLSNNNVQVKIVDYDLLPVEAKREHLKFLQPINPQLSFPTLIVGELAVIGEDYTGAKEVLGLS